MAYDLADLKARIRLETDKDDIDSGGEAEEALNTAIARAVEFYSEEKFWFSNDSGTVSTTSGQAYVVRPYGVRVASRVVYSGEALEKTDLSDILGRTEEGQPTHWADNGDFIQLWPEPDAAYSLTVYGATQIDAPTSDTDETVWTNEAYDLIAARVKYLLFRDVWRDIEGAKISKEAEIEELTRLRRETRKRSKTRLRAAGDEPWAAQSNSFNINRGY